MKSTFDYISIGTISAALAVASGGRWLAWFLLDLSLMWLYLRITTKPKPAA